MLSRDSIQDIVDCVAATTPGEWFCRCDGWTVRVSTGMDDQDYGPLICSTQHTEVSLEEQVANALFISHAKTDITNLVNSLLSAYDDLDRLSDKNREWLCGEAGVNNVLASILLYWDEARLISLRDALIRRTPGPLCGSSLDVVYQENANLRGEVEALRLRLSQESQDASR